MLRRIGKKTRLIPDLLHLFPDNIKMFIDLFMGSGDVSFVMAERVKYVFANDNDEDVYNLFMQMKENKTELTKAFKSVPYHEKIFNDWAGDCGSEDDPIWKAVRFLYLSNFSYLGKCSCLSFMSSNPKAITEENLTKTILKENIQYTCCDFRDVLRKIGFRKRESGKNDKDNAFIYADPPYLGTTNNYQNSFKRQDTEDLFQVLIESGIRFGISEFDNPVLLDLADKYGLEVTVVGERRSLKNRRNEIYVSNYSPCCKQMDLFQTELSFGSATTADECLTIQ